MERPAYDRAAEDVGNIVHLEHVNLLVPDQRLATAFYVSGLGLTRDPYLMTGIDNMWVNVGQSQFHLITGKAQVLRGHTALVIPGRDRLLARLARAGKDLAGTAFGFAEQEDFVEATCPWGNRIRVFEPGPRFGRIQLGMAHVAFDVPPGTAERIGAFYRNVLGAPVSPTEGAGVKVRVGRDQHLGFHETDRPLPAFDGHHIQIYLANFSGPHAALRAAGLVSQESNQWQYRFVDITDPSSGEVLYSVEHEVRSLTHPLYGRPLVNRNPDQTNANYAPGYQDRPWALPPAQ